MNIDVYLVNLDKVLLYILILTTFLYLYKYRKEKILDYTVALIAALSVSELLKTFINKPRPVPKFPGLVFEGSSFPSTHTTLAFVTAVFICHTLTSWGRGTKNGLPKHRLMIELVVVFFAVLVGYLRVFVGAHYLIDVIAGAILGSLISMPFRYYDVFVRKLK